nr:hypothetical protein GCM10020185_21550 [Pseudomonas brassicacearum subsp. brassicacearum]
MPIKNGKNHPDHGNLQVDARAPDHSGKNVAAEIVRAERMGQARPQQADIGVLGNRIEGRDPGCEECEQQPAKQNRQAQHGGQSPVAQAQTQRKTPGGTEGLAAHRMFTRGSIITVSTSARKLTVTVARASTMATPWTTM